MFILIIISKEEKSERAETKTKKTTRDASGRRGMTFW